MQNEPVSDCDESERSSTPRLLDRRRYLNLSAAAVGTVFGTTSVSAGDVSGDGKTSRASGSVAVHRHGISFEQELDAVDDLGLDPTGNEPIDGSVPTSDDTLVSFPPGTYLVENTIDPNDVSNWGIRGTGDYHGDVRFVVPDHEVMDVFTPDGENVLIENVTFDQGPENHTSIGNQVVVTDGLEIHDVEYAGFNPNLHTGGTHSLAVRVTDPDGVGVIEGFKHVGPSDFAEDPLHNPIPIWTGGGAKGTLYIRDAHIENGGCHSIYGSKTEGPVRVEGGLFKNCQNTHMRLCGEGTWLKDATVVVDTEHAHPDNLGEYTASTGIWWESGPYQQTGGLIENCTIVCETSAPNSGLIKIDQTAGAVTVRNTHVHNEVDGVPSIVAQRPGDSPFGWPAPERPWDVTIDSVTISGPGGSDAALEIVGRDGSVVRNCVIDGGNGDGVRLVDSSDCTLGNSLVTVPGRRTDFTNASASTANIRPIPDGLRPGHKLLEIETTSDDVVSYEFAVDGQLSGIDPNSEDSVDGPAATGAVAGGTDTYSFTGLFTEFQANGDLAVRVDGKEIDPTVSRKRRLEIEGSRTDTVVSYEFAVEGALEGVDLNAEDAVRGRTASGAVAGGTDAYRVEGGLSRFSADGDPTVRIDGMEIDTGGPGKRFLEIEGSRTDTVVSYEFAVEGDLEGVDLNAEDAIRGRTASGAVAGGTDTYRVGGDFTTFRADGDVTVRIDGTEVDRNALDADTLPHVSTS